MEYMENNTAVESVDSAAKDATNSEVATYTGSIVVENEEISSEPKTVNATQSTNSEKFSETEKFGLININEINIDKNYFGRIAQDAETVTVYKEAIIAGSCFPAIKLEMSTNKLLDGGHTYKALRTIDKMCKKGELKKENLPNAFDGDLVKVVYVEIPERIQPCLFSLNCNMTHGMKASVDDIRAAVKVQFEQEPGFTVKDLSNFLCVSEQTARKYAANALRERKEKIKEYVIESRKQGKTQEEIEKDLHNMFPKASGISQSTVSNILLENSTNRKTNKTVSKNEIDLGSNSNEDAPISTGEENPVEASIKSTPEDSESDSLNSEESTDSNVPGNPNFEECMKVLEEAETTLLDRVEFLSGLEVDEILNRIEPLANNFEDKARKLKLIV
jgi:hypothetical protein